MLLIHRLFIKTALVYLLCGALMGGWMVLGRAGVLPFFQRGGGFISGFPHAMGRSVNPPPPPINLIEVHAHLVGIGFFLLLVCGVALWMFPRKTGESRDQAARDPLAWATYFLIAGGLAVRTLASLFPTVFGNAVMALSVFLQVGGILAFVITIWPRVYLPGAKLSAGTTTRK